MEYYLKAFYAANIDIEIYNKWQLPSKITLNIMEGCN